MTVESLNIPPERITIDYHRAHPDISLETYVRSKMLATADRVLTRKRVYLDTRFWILLRDVCLGRSKDTLHDRLLDHLRELVNTGQVICPINADTLAELLKQRDLTTRLVTAKLIDELSLGAALQSYEERTGVELRHYVQLTRSGAAALDPLERLVWTAPAYLLGYNFPVWKSLPNDEILACQKAFTDYLWDFPFADQITFLPLLPEALSSAWDAIAAKLNREIKKHDTKALSLGELHLYEFEGSLELDKLTSILGQLEQKETGVAPSPAIERKLTPAARELIASMVQGLRDGTIGRQLPSSVIRAGLHAGVRRNRGRQFKGNDLHDFGHATAALAYCDYFATDKSLRHLVVKELGFDRQYESVVIAEPAELLAALEQIPLTRALKTQS